MKKIFTILGLLLCFNSFSQSYFNPPISFSQGHSEDFDIAAYSVFKNNFNSDQLKWVRIQNTLTPGWTSAYCDCEFCRDKTTDSASFTYPIGDSCTTSAHFYADSIKGTGIMKIKVFARNDTSNYVIGEYRTTGWGVSISFIEKEKLILSPNPANNVLNIRYGSGESYTISVISINGKVLFNGEVESITNTIDISALDKGMYSVKVESTGKVFYSKFIKL